MTLYMMCFSVYLKCWGKRALPLQAKDERNYHIFYEMLAGLPSQQKQAFYLQEAETYYYLNQVEDTVEQNIDIFLGVLKFDFDF